MNEHDRKNLFFLMNSDQSNLKVWYESATQDDRIYAMELIAEYKAELELKMTLCFDPEIESISQSSEILSKYRLGKRQ